MQKLKDTAGPKPYIRIGIPSQKPLNTTEIRVRGKVGGDPFQGPKVKQSINWKRINAETNRHDYAQARYVPIPLLVKTDGKRSIPVPSQRKRFMQAAVQAGSR